MNQLRLDRVGMRAAVAAGLAVACVFIQWPARAQAVTDETQLPALAQRWVDQALASQVQRTDPSLRLQAKVGAPDARLRLAPCARVDVHLPPGARLWGNSRVALRCLEGPVRWNVTLPVAVSALGQAWVLRRDVPAGTNLAAADLMQAEVDWAADPSPVLAGREPWQSQVAVRSLMAGQVLRQNMVRAAQVFQAGAQVKVLVQGGSFQITAQGQALSAGVVGQPAQVRVDNGRVLSATVLDARTVRLEL